MNVAGTLILLCGLPGSGKTTYARKQAIERRAVTMEPDEWIEMILADSNDTQERDRLRDPIEDIQWELAKRYVSLGHTVVLEFGFWSEEERSQFAVQALELGARIELVYFEVKSFDTLWERVERRNAELVSGPWVMSRVQLEIAWNQFEPPNEDEATLYDEFTRITVI